MVDKVHRPTMVLKPPSRWTPVQAGELWQFRDLVWQLVSRDLRLRYKQTVLGVAWVVLQPLLSAGIFSFVFGKVADLPSDGVPYFVFAYVGMMVWTVFSQTLSKISVSLVSNSQLISKVYFPRLALPLSTIGSTLVDFVVALAMGVIVMIAGGVAPGVALVTMPYWLLLAFLLGGGAGLISAALMVQYRDVGYVLPVIVQLLLYGTPIAYGLSAVPESARWAVDFNPLTGVLEGFRWSMLQTNRPDTSMFVWATVASIGLFVAGTYVFSARERGFADVI